MTASDAPRIDLPVLETARLRLRKLSLDDTEDVFAYASDPEVARYVTWDAHRSIQDSAAFLNMVKQKYENGQIAEWGIVDTSTGRVVGTCGFTWVRSEHGKAEIAYAISRSYWNQGLVTEAVGACISYGFDVLKLNRIEARCMPDNIGSERVMQKCGMRCEGTLRQTMLVKGKHVDLKLYAILQEEWRRGNVAS
ncbi:MAG: GNAT family N-acetyltransferase [Candidatus Edwardsbacteria bacterium]|jgi:ribosomal-protein-alanine N-acetyltransferase|nr:GNAT family N-acetyltransferase [Candidatus Edwardsbacteria bacterium]